MRHLVESLGKFITEGKAKRVRKARMKRRRQRLKDDNDKALFRQAMAIMKGRQKEIEKMLFNVTNWDFDGVPKIDKRDAEYGEANMGVGIVYDGGFPIGAEYEYDEPFDWEDYHRMRRQKQVPHEIEVNKATGNLNIGFQKDGDTYYVAVTADEFDPQESTGGWGMGSVSKRSTGEPVGVSLVSGTTDETFVEVAWKRKRKPFDVNKDLMPMIKQAIIEAGKTLPDYGEYESDWWQTPEQRYM